MMIFLVLTRECVDDLELDPCDLHLLLEVVQQLPHAHPRALPAQLTALHAHDGAREVLQALLQVNLN